MKSRDLPVDMKALLQSDIYNRENISDEESKELLGKLAYYIVSNDYVVSPSYIISNLIDSKDYDINELLILIFKFGMLSKHYIDNPISLIHDALSNKELFNKTQLNELIISYKKQTKDSADFEDLEDLEDAGDDSDDEFLMLMQKLKNGEYLTNDEINLLIDKGISSDNNKNNKN
jgi:hypothetical protein